VGASPGDAGRLELGLGSNSANVTTPSNEVASDMPSARTPVSQVLITIDEMAVHSDWDGWKTIRTDSFTVDLMSMQMHPIDVGGITLAAGKVTQVRLVISEGSVVTSDGRTHPLRVPSGPETGIKLDGPWFVAPCQLVTLHLQFEPLGSVNVHAPGDGDPWILNPVIHVAQDSPVMLAGCAMSPTGHGVHDF
jgi:hypothetical protein